MQELVSRKMAIFLLGFMVGAVFLCSISVVQKLIAGYNPFILKAYIVPALFGGSAGGLLLHYLRKVKVLNRQLQERVDRLESILSLCCHCKKIRKPGCDGFAQESWQQLESFLGERTQKSISHGICPECMKKLYGKEYGNSAVDTVLQSLDFSGKV